MTRRLPLVLRRPRVSAAAPDEPGSGVVPMCDLAPAGRASVVEVSGGALPSTARRLTDLGFTPGTVIEVVRRAPLRDPVIYRVRDYEVCLRRAQAECVLVRVVAG
ncbi:FeoA family protein [Actinoplanes sp. CA-030573]|uniref:FeoA family protein n=1 Tax=Actinoplanes sp. CA-030573 TaxID=3239898 RepID=UPI003D92779E